MADSLAISVPTPALPRWGTTFDIELRDHVHAAITGQVSTEQAAQELDEALQDFFRSEAILIDFDGKVTWEEPGEGIPCRVLFLNCMSSVS